MARIPPGTGGKDEESRSLLATDEGYDPDTVRGVHRRLGVQGMNPATLTALACVAWIATRLGPSLPDVAYLRWPALVAAVAACLVGNRGTLVGAIFCAAIAGGAGAWQATAPVPAHECVGVGVVRSDPHRRGHAVTAIVEIDGRRWRAIAHGRPAGRLARAAAGQHVAIEATCAPGTGRFAAIDRVRHIIGVASIVEIAETIHPGSPLTVASNRLRRALADGSRALGSERGALFLGLVIGDDRAQNQEMVEDFRAAGLSHLTAVSGQNIAYLVALASPILVLLGRWWRLGVVVALVSWFVVLTRAEPSVVRAAAMAIVSAVAATASRPMNARMTLAVAVMVMLAIDPMLAWSVGFALSVGATAGLAWLSGPLRTIVGSGALGRVIVPTVAAQLGTAPVSVAIFGALPIIGLVANPLSLPVAGAVMTVGIPLALVASIIDPVAPVVGSMLSPLVGWVALVAQWSAAAGPTGWANAASWGALAVWATRRARTARRRTG